MTGRIIPRVRFTIRKPDKTRRSFAILKDTLYLDGRREQRLVEDEALVALNENVRAGLLSVAEAEIQVRSIIKPRLQAQAGIQDRKDLEELLTEGNRKVFHKFWAHISRERKLKHPTSTRNDLLAALRSIEPLGLAVATRDELMDALDSLSDKRYRRHAIRINQLLAFMKREITLPLRQVEAEDVHFLTWDELQQMLPNIYTPEVRTLAVVLFCTGVRLGEAFQLSLRKLKPNRSLFIDKQLTHNMQVRGLKNGKPHDTILLPQGMGAFREWCTLENKEQWRNRASHQLLTAARKTFPDKERHVSPHDLRHSYAVYWLEKRATVTEVASLLGDTEATVRRHYTGWIMNERLIDNLNRLLVDNPAEV